MIFEEEFPSFKGYELTDISKSGLTIEKEDVEKHCLDKQKVRDVLQKEMDLCDENINIVSNQIYRRNLM